MATLPILEIPHPKLRKRAKKVRGFDKSMKKLAYDMVDTMHEAGGVGLAANQVGQLWRIIVLQMPEEEEARIYFDPEIIRNVGMREVEEGCLSLPKYVNHIKRAEKITLAGLDRIGKPFTLEGEGLLARAMQHEYDHVQGILMLDRLSPLKRSLYIKRVKKLEKIRANEHAAVA